MKIMSRREPESEANAFITIEMARQDGAKVRKMLGGSGSNNACDEIQYPPEEHRLHLRRDPPREMSDDERALHAMCLLDLKRVSEKFSKKGPKETNNRANGLMPAK